MGSLHRWLCRRSHDKLYTVNPELLAKFTRNEPTLWLPAHGLSENSQRYFGASEALSFGSAFATTSFGSLPFPI
jgi:hypothetical protein